VRFGAVFVHTGWQYLVNGCLQPIGRYITQAAKLYVNDTLLALILRMAQ
jgi:hypothetical protein